ncbi:vinorine synthase-like [Chenopodium quinoa]|uniref:vinorine synthase-like n=1 Tax=Chenopodium quinoa TaxID=63459 RepID=UPI000B78B80C|nr:vinorine synthase-like [Chenopodium quinoa]
MMKPSIPTPSHLKPYHLCLLDQFFGLTYVPQVLFYQNNNPSKHDESQTNNGKSLVENDEIIMIITRLKESLSKTLSVFYPLVGRLTADESAIDCSDEGIAFIQARTNITLGEFLKSPNRVDELPQFIPGISTRIVSALEVVPLAIQVTVFGCGGLAVGSQYLHKIFDGASWGNFLNTWAAVANQGVDQKIVKPDFATAISLFPPCSWASKRSSKILTTRALLDGGNHEDEDDQTCVVKAFVFIPEAIAKLQAMAKSELVNNPTRIEALSAFIWKHAMAAAAAVAASSCKSNVNVIGPSVLIHSVNIRPRTNPPIPSTAIGNLIIHAYASYKELEENQPISDMDLKDLVAETRKGLSEAKDAEFLSKFKGENGAEAMRQYKQKVADISKDKNINTYKFTSWSKLDVLPNFGFIGMPVWIGFTGGKLSSLFKNLVTMIEIPASGGIEVWLILDEKEMSVLRTSEDFLVFASLTS